MILNYEHKTDKPNYYAKLNTDTEQPKLMYKLPATKCYTRC